MPTKQEVRDRIAKDIIERRKGDIEWVMEALSEMENEQRKAWHNALLKRDEGEFLRIANEAVEDWLYPPEHEIDDALGLERFENDMILHDDHPAYD